jgi:hypothetical protein
MRRKDGRETWRRLLEWDKGQAPSERLAGQILRMEGFESIDPSHPLGGRDGLKDIVCARGSERWIGAAYFPRGQQPLKAISKKFNEDFVGVADNKADGFAFVTNQELKLGEREALVSCRKGTSVEILHLERIASILDSPQCYGMRLDYLDIEMTKEEQVAFVALQQSEITQMKNTLATLVKSITEEPSGRKAQSEMPIVSPRTIGGGIGLLGTVPQPRECQSCHHIFLVERSNPSTAVTAFAYGPGSMTIVTCPFCGHSTRYNEWPYI